MKTNSGNITLNLKTKKGKEKIRLYTPNYPENKYFLKYEYYCDNFEDVNQQVICLDKSFKELHIIYYKYLREEFNLISNNAQNLILEKYKVNLNASFIEKKARNDLSIKSKDNESLTAFRNFLKAVLKAINSIKQIDEVDDDNFKLYINESFSYTIGDKYMYVEFPDIEKIVEKVQNFETNLKDIIKLKEVKTSFLDYLKRERFYEFSDFLFSNNIWKIKKFSNCLKSYERKLSYLNYAYDDILIEKDKVNLKIEIKRVKDVIKIEKDNLKSLQPDLSIEKSIKKIKKIKHFDFQGEELSICILFELLYKSGFLTDQDYKSRYAIIANSFNNRYSSPYKNTQLASTVKTHFNDNNGEFIISSSKVDCQKFNNLLMELKKILH